MSAETGITVDGRKSLAQDRDIFLACRQVHLVGDDAPWPLRKARVIQIDLAAQALQIFDRVAPFASGGINDEEQELAPRDVPQEIVPEPHIPMRAFDQARNVSDGRASIIIQFEPLQRSAGAS